MARGIAGYGRYTDDPEHVGCPFARTDMTPCVARDGRLALNSPAEASPVCVGCNNSLGYLIEDLARFYEPAQQQVIRDTEIAADEFAAHVRAATEPLAADA